MLKVATNGLTNLFCPELVPIPATASVGEGLALPILEGPQLRLLVTVNVSRVSTWLQTPDR